MTDHRIAKVVALVDAYADAVRLSDKHETRAEVETVIRSLIGDGEVVAWRLLTFRGATLGAWNEGAPSKIDEDYAYVDGYTIQRYYSHPAPAQKVPKGLVDRLRGMCCAMQMAGLKTTVADEAIVFIKQFPEA